jgi:hypothetical protein
MSSPLPEEIYWRVVLFYIFLSAYVQDRSITPERNDYQLTYLICFSLFFLFSFASRTDLSEVLESQLKTDVMLVAGSLASHLHTVRTMANHLNKTKSTLVLIDGVGDVLNEAVSSRIFPRSASFDCAQEFD